MLLVGNSTLSTPTRDRVGGGACSMHRGISALAGHRNVKIDSSSIQQSNPLEADPVLLGGSFTCHSPDIL